MSTNRLAPDPLTDIDGPTLEEPDYNEPANGTDDEPEEEPEDEVPEEDPDDEPLADEDAGVFAAPADRSEVESD